MTAQQSPEIDTNTLPPFIREDNAGWRIQVKVQPGAKKSELCEQSEDFLRIRLAAPAVENKANKALTEFLADLLKIKKNKIKLVSGEKSRNKTLLVSFDAQPAWQSLLKV